MFKKTLLAAAFSSFMFCAGLTVPNPANAFEHVGPYGFFKGGLNYTRDQSFDTGNGRRTPQSSQGVGEVETEMDPGLIVLGGAGYDFGYYRVEGEVAYRAGEVSSMTGGGRTLNGTDGDARSLAFMINGYYDFSNQSVYTPYVGMGLGMAIVGADQYRNSTNVILAGKDTVFAYQAMAGIDYDISNYFSMGAEYRYFATADLDMTTTLGANSTDLDYGAHSLLVGMKYKIAPRKVYAKRRYY